MLIRPSIMDEKLDEVAQGVFYRLFPEFQNRDLVVIGVEASSERVTDFVHKLKNHVESFHKNQIEIFNEEGLLNSHEKLKNCSHACWIMTEAQSTSDIAPMPSVLELAGLNEKNRFTLTIFEFDSYNEEIIPACEKQKRLTLECLKNLAIKEAGRKMKEKDKKYFFLKQYNSRDYFLFFQK